MSKGVSLAATKQDAIILAPYTLVYEEALASLPEEATRVEMTSEESYFYELASAYFTGLPLVIIEHDVVVPEGAVEELLACPEPWCGFPIAVSHGRSKVCLGLTKLAMNACYPDLMVGMNKQWWVLDIQIEARLTARGFTVHEHQGAVKHLNPLITCTVERPCGECYGCLLRAKSLNISGETVAGHPFGVPPKILTDKVEDQRLEAGKELQSISDRMKAGGAVVEDRLQKDVDLQTSRAKDAATWPNPISEAYR
jgi:hypothetical protein